MIKSIGTFQETIQAFTKKEIIIVNQYAGLEFDPVKAYQRSRTIIIEWRGKALKKRRNSELTDKARAFHQQILLRRIHEKYLAYKKCVEKQQKLAEIASQESIFTT